MEKKENKRWDFKPGCYKLESILNPDGSPCRDPEYYRHIGELGWLPAINEGDSLMFVLLFSPSGKDISGEFCLTDPVQSYRMGYDNRLVVFAKYIYVFS